MQLVLLLLPFLPFFLALLLGHRGYLPLDAVVGWREPDTTRRRGPVLASSDHSTLRAIATHQWSASALVCTTTPWQFDYVARPCRPPTPSRRSRPRSPSRRPRSRRART